MKLLLQISLLTITTLVLGQEKYPFEEFPKIKYHQVKDWKMYEKTDRTHFTLTIPSFFSNTDSLTIQLTSFKVKLDSSYVQLYRNKKQIQKIYEPMFFIETNVLYSDSVRIMDVNGDGLKDVKLLIPYMGNGLASLNLRIIYLFQNHDSQFTKTSYLDKMGVHITERDFDGDNKYEIMTMTLKGYQKHNYWTFNIYNFKNRGLENQNARFGYPIMIQYLFRDNYKVTEKISIEKMKTFGDNKPIEYNEK